jgi:hypothetical protein
LNWLTIAALTSYRNNQDAGPMNKLSLSLALLFCALPVQAATLPDHQALSILIIADEVNPHGLNDAELTQPEDLAPALSANNSALNISTVITVNSQCADDALSSLQSDQRPDVVLYFAHRAATSCDGENAQPALTSLLEAGLTDGLGIVVLHHGLYVDFINRGAKAELLHLIGAESDSIEWNTETGQRVINVAGNHFITSNGIVYEEDVAFTGTTDVTPGTYPAFTNLPDELYEITRLHDVAGETRTPLFASDSGDERLLGYVLQRNGWSGRVVVYQSGEYQPNALDNREGPNFQILINALYFAVHGSE